LAALELIFSILLSAYENFMSVKLVVPITSKAFDDINELNDNNYTFVVMDRSLIASRLINKYKDEHSKVRKVY